MAYEEIPLGDFCVRTDIGKKLRAQAAWRKYEKKKERDKKLGVTIYAVGKHHPENLNLLKNRD